MILESVGIVTELRDPSVTVIVPVYNSASTLSRAVSSVLDQTLQNIEVLIVDDGSTDETYAIATLLQQNDNRIRLIKLPTNGGKARAMNVAMSQARGRWIALIDADDRYMPTRLQTLLDAGETQGVDLVADNQVHVDDANGKQVRQAFSASGPGREIRIADFIAHSETSGTFDFGILKIMVRTNFIRENGVLYHPEARFSEDFYYLVDFFSVGGRAWLVHDPLYEWTLPFSPSKRRWTSTGSGAWRYDYRNALATNNIYKTKLQTEPAGELLKLLHRRDKQYQTMVYYLDAQRAFLDEKDFGKASSLIFRNPQTWPLLLKRILGRLRRFVFTEPKNLQSK